LALVPLDALNGLHANDAWKHFRRVSAANLTNPVHELALEGHSRNDWPCLMRRNQAESITKDDWAEEKRSQDDSMPAHGEAEEAGDRFIAARRSFSGSQVLTQLQ
jgi:hypothetical protein